MKNYVKILACISLLALAMTAFCACDTDWYKGRRPTDQPGTKWACEEYGMLFEVDEHGLVKNGVLKPREETFVSSSYGRWVRHT